MGSINHRDWLGEIIKEAFDHATQGLSAEQVDALATHFGVE